MYRGVCACLQNCQSLQCSHTKSMDVDEACADPESFVRKGSNSDNVFFKLVKGERIQIPLQADHHRKRNAIYAQADLRLCWSHVPHCWKSHVGLIYNDQRTAFSFISSPNPFRHAHLLTSKIDTLNSQKNTFSTYGTIERLLFHVICLQMIHMKF